MRRVRTFRGCRIEGALLSWLGFRKGLAMALPRVFLIFNKTDWPCFTRQDEVRAIATVGRKRGFTVIAVNRPLCPLSTAIRKRHRVSEYFRKEKLEPIAENLFLASPKYWLSDVVAWRYPWITRRNVVTLRKWYDRVRRSVRRAGLERAARSVADGLSAHGFQSRACLRIASASNRLISSIRALV